MNRREREKHANKSEEKRMVQSSILAFIDNSTVSFVRFRIEYEKMRHSERRMLKDFSVLIVLNFAKIEFMNTN